MKKILLSIGALGAILVGASMFSAFEAHVVNVTARIENALEVPLKFIDYGTVFPQEYLIRDLGVELSQSFKDEGRVDDVQYIIRQKPKCAITWNNGQEYDATVGQNGEHLYTRTGHIKLGDDPSTDPVEDATHVYIDCGPAPRTLDAQKGEVWGVLPNLCPYLSKHKENDGQQNESQINAFHQPWTINGSVITWNDAKGYLTKIGKDISDLWKIDLAVPCFGGYCAQDWASYVEDKNPGQGVNASSWTQPIANEHKVFGCDLWIEVGGISTSTPGLGCLGTADTVFVIDSSGSIGDGNMLTVETAMKALASAMAPSANGNHIGVVDFDDDATLNQTLTDVLASIDAAIDAMSSGGLTAMGDGIALASTELASVRDRNDVTVAPDYMVIVTDGVNNAGQDPAAAAAAAKLAGTTIYVVGVGSGIDTNFLQNTIASSPAHYFAADFVTLQSTLISKIGQCN